MVLQCSLHWDTSTTGREGVEEKELLTASTAGTGRETDPKAQSLDIVVLGKLFLFSFLVLNHEMLCAFIHVTQILPCGLLRPRGL